MRTIRKMGYLGDFPEPVWYDEDGIVNLISLYILQQYYWVVYDNREEDVFRVQLHDGRTLRFEPTEKGLYVCRAGPDDGDHWAFSITTVQDKRGQYTKRAYNDAVRSRRVQNIIGFPTDRKLATIIDHNELLNNPVLRADVRAATDIFGPNGDSLKGKTTSRKPKRVDGVIADVPDDVLRTYRKVVLEVDMVLVLVVLVVVGFELDGEGGRQVARAGIDRRVSGGGGGRRVREGGGGDGAGAGDHLLVALLKVELLLGVLVLFVASPGRWGRISRGGRHFVRGDETLFCLLSSTSDFLGPISGTAGIASQGETP